MFFEVHITVNTTDVNKFVSDCKNIGVKPIVIETIIGNNQVMTSSVHEGYDYLNVMNAIKFGLLKLKYDVVRCKIEAKPEQEINPNFIYFETHLRLKLNKNANYDHIFSICKERKFHVSRNLFKKDSEYNYQMITYRQYEPNIHSFNLVVDSMKTYLDKNNIVYDKVEIEECIYDSNVSIDENWLNS